MQSLGQLCFHRQKEETFKIFKIIIVVHKKGLLKCLSHAQIHIEFKY